jgi:hypothetical protein
MTDAGFFVVDGNYNAELHKLSLIAKWSIDRVPKVYGQETLKLLILTLNYWQIASISRTVGRY